MAYMRGEVFPDFFPAMEMPAELRLPEAFRTQIPEIARMVNTDVDAMLHNDPAVTDRGEVVLSYPLTQVMIHFRTAHALYQLGVPRIPRLLTELAGTSCVSHTLPPIIVSCPMRTRPRMEVFE